MKKTVVSLCLSVVFCSSAFAGSGPHWGYSGQSGPEHWGKLDKSYEMCSKGRNQSPIDLTGFIEADLKPITFSYESAATEILNNGHSVQVNFPKGSTITLDGKIFELKQFHFHAPSENVINGKYFPMEAHLVHADSEGNLAVIAVMFEDGEANQVISSLWKQMPEKENDKIALSTPVKAADLLPAERDYYRFNGSLTTPPCTEGVYWLMMKQPVSISGEQVEAFEHVMHHPNNRPLQPANARPVLQ